MRRILGLGIGLIVWSAPVAAQQVELGGEVRPRFEMRSPDGFDQDSATEYTSMRTRLSLRADLPRGVAAYVEFQDVRIWGEEGSTVEAMADALDLHQGWIELGDAETGEIAVRAGRQELSYGEERLIGALDWAQQARSFDGARVRFRPGPAGWVDSFAARLREDEVSEESGSLFGVYGGVDVVGRLEAYVIYNTGSVGEEDLTDQYTVGGRWSGGAGPIDARVEGAYQGGQRRATDVSAYLLAVRAGAELGETARAELWYDRLSGDEAPSAGDLKVFDTLFATNHKFYGAMDLFTDIPRDTDGRGLQDVALRTSWRPVATVRLGLDAHAFFYAASDGLESGHLGEELDLSAGWAYAPGVALTGGLSWFTAGDGWTDPDQTMSWLFVMMDVAF